MKIEMGAVCGMCEREGGILKEAEDLGDVGVDGRIILKWILKELNKRAWTEFIRLRVRIIYRLL
jgi:hypothetical protein